MDTTELTQKNIDVWASNFSLQRQQIVNNKNANDRLLSICGDLCLLNTAKKAGIDVLNIKYSSHGKPYFEGNPLYFSVSHKGTKSVCVSYNKPIGIDIETIKPFNKNTAKRICTDSELEFIGNNEKHFATIWAIKEAYSKLDGRGISLGLGNIITNMENFTVQSAKFTLKQFDNYICAIVFEV